MGNDRAAAARIGRSRAAPTRALILAGALALAPGAAAIERVASLNLCTDSMLFELLPAERIVSVTHLSRDPNLSPFHAQAMHMAINHGDVEEVLLHAPELVVTGEQTSALTERLLAKLAVPVARFAHANDFATYQRNLRRLGEMLGVSAVAESRIDQLAQALSQAPGARAKTIARAAILYQPNGYTPGETSLMTEIMRYAGLRNMAAKLGYRLGGYLPLEVLLLEQPMLLVFSERHTAHPSLAEAQLDHPALRHWSATRAANASRSLRVPERLWTCAGMFNLEALAALMKRP